MTDRVKKRACTCCEDSALCDEYSLPWHYNLRQVIVRYLPGEPSHGAAPELEFFAFNEITESIRINSGISDETLLLHLEHQVLKRLGIETLPIAAIHISYTIADHDETSQPESAINDETDYWHTPRTFLAELYKI
jgi:hypothetical protein